MSDSWESINDTSLDVASLRLTQGKLLSSGASLRLTQSKLLSTSDLTGLSGNA